MVRGWIGQNARALAGDPDLAIEDAAGDEAQALVIHTGVELPSSSAAQAARPTTAAGRKRAASNEKVTEAKAQMLAFFD